MRSAVFERQQGQNETALKTLSAAVKKFPKFAKLYMIQGQIHQAAGNIIAAQSSFAAGIKACRKEPTFWILASRHEELDNRSNRSIKAHALLEKARLVNPANEPHASRKTKSVDALRKTKDSPLVVCTVDRVLWADRMICRFVLFLSKSIFFRSMYQIIIYAVGFFRFAVSLAIFCFPCAQRNYKGSVLSRIMAYGTGHGTVANEAAKSPHPKSPHRKA